MKTFVEFLNESNKNTIDVKSAIEMVKDASINERVICGNFGKSTISVVKEESGKLSLYIGIDYFNPSMVRLEKFLNFRNDMTYLASLIDYKKVKIETRGDVAGDDNLDDFGCAVYITSNKYIGDYTISKKDGKYMINGGSCYGLVFVDSLQEAAEVYNAYRTFKMKKADSAVQKDLNLSKEMNKITLDQILKYKESIKDLPDLPQQFWK